MPKPLGSHTGDSRCADSTRHHPSIKKSTVATPAVVLKTGHARDAEGVCSGWWLAVEAIGRGGDAMDTAKWARFKQYTYDCRLARGASKDPSITKEQHERLRKAYERHRAGEMTREEFEAWCSGFRAGKSK